MQIELKILKNVFPDFPLPRLVQHEKMTRGPRLHEKIPTCAAKKRKCLGFFCNFFLEDWAKPVRGQKVHTKRAKI